MSPRLALSIFHVLLCCLLTSFFAGMLVGCAHRTPASLTETKPINLTFTTAEGYVFDALIDAPPVTARNGWGVLMMGGGYGNDLDWTVPGSLTMDGKMVQFTINGETHRDAPLISRALVDRGFVVMRWSTIRQNDPLKDRWPMESTTYPLPTMLEHARAALAAFRKQGTAKPDRILLLGQSLGGTRACTIAGEDDAIAGLILLVPAQLTREGTAGKSVTDYGMRWGEEVLEQRRIPAIIICGEIDKHQGQHGPIMQRIVEEHGLSQVEVHVMPGLGHQLSREEDGRFDPIDDGVVRMIADWAANIANVK